MCSLEFGLTTHLTPERDLVAHAAYEFYRLTSNAGEVSGHPECSREVRQDPATCAVRPVKAVGPCSIAACREPA
jgi:hypothetical protein